MNHRLERIADQAQIGGVCAGLADYFGISRTWVRVFFVIGLFLPHFPALIIYVILWIAMPERRTVGYSAQSTVYSTPYFAMNPYNPNKPASPDRGLIGGAVLIVLGVLFLLDRYFNIDFGDLWPFVLIAIGLWLVFRDRIKTPYSGTGSYFDSTTNPTNVYTPPTASTPPTSPTTPASPTPPGNNPTGNDPTGTL